MRQIIGRYGMRTSAAALFAAGIVAAAPSLAAENLPSQEDLWRIVQHQQSLIDSLMAKQGAAEKKITETDEKVETVGAALDRVSAAPGAGGGGWWERTQIGGYGELHYNAGEKEQIDLHRFVLYVGHNFNDWIRLQSEIEIEHLLVGESKPGEVEIEQAFIEFDLTEGAGLRFGETDRHKAKAGVFLMPVGIMNEVHEPPTFFGVERNNVEKDIIPTTWWEGGVALSGEFGGGFGYDLAIHSGLDVPTTGGNAFKIRNGRQKVAEANAKDPAYTLALSWSGVPGVEIGGALQYQHDLTQGDVKTSATLGEAHIDLRRGGFGLRALGARWDLDSAAAEAVGRDIQQGWYVEPSYRWRTGAGEVGVFARYSQWDNNAGNAADTERAQIDFGANYWPHEDVVLKIDYQFEDMPAGTAEDNRLNLGVGFVF